MTGSAGARAAVTDAHRRDWASVLAATLHTARDLDLAEECVQEAYAEALECWSRVGAPDNPAAWLTTTARRRAIDALRRQSVLRAKLPSLVEAGPSSDPDVALDQWSLEVRDSSIEDERLRLIFMCCHPALALEAQMALTLRLVCGMSTADIARAFLVSESTMAARLTRAKRKIAGARIPFRVPGASDLPDRLRAVLGVVHVLFAHGHTAPSGDSLMRPALVDESLHLTQVLRELMPDERELDGLLALLLVTDARRMTRVDSEGRPQQLAKQDRSRWNVSAIAEARVLVDRGLRDEHPGRFVFQAAIALEHARAATYEATDWTKILRLYDDLLARWPSPVVSLNRAVALSMVDGPADALVVIEQLERDGQLDHYHYLPVVKADLLHRLGDEDAAFDVYQRAMGLTENSAERDALATRLAEWQSTKFGDRPPPTTIDPGS
jgi:RNA polymerase sigma-70 factor (ECF subfamily)